ncbi:hypothetical protein [Actinomadura oligospora]|uniref:hypothetical protein n=1 Tax=Actinomadura oligospora TaxID=111804 RepID=UPI0012FBC373|nr:hypothetical protein [Actinomadura oligospora]
MGDGAHTHKVDLRGNALYCADARELRTFLEPWAVHLDESLVADRTFAEIWLRSTCERDGVEMTCVGYAPRRRFGIRRRPGGVMPPRVGEGAGEIRREQRRAAQVLGSLLGEDLPVLGWHVHDSVFRGQVTLSGSLSTYPVAQAEGPLRAEAVAREAMDRWGRFLGSDPVERALPRTRVVEVKAEWDEFRVGVSAYWTP